MTESDMKNQMIRVSGLTEAATWNVEECYPDSDNGHELHVGVTFIEGKADDLLDAAFRLRVQEVTVEWGTGSREFYQAACKRSEKARRRWATKIERAVMGAARAKGDE